MRTVSSRPKALADGSSGYLHSLDGKWEFKPPVRKSEQRKADVAIPVLMERYRRNIGVIGMKNLADTLGVNACALDMLEVGRRDSWTWAFPMKNSRREIVGIRLRTDGGKKFAEQGSHNGLFIPKVKPESMVFLPEGPTNTAAALSIGLYAVGRPSNCAGVWDIIDFIQRNNIKRAVVIADTDEDKERKDGSHFNPGFDGAGSLSEQLTIPSCIIALPAKDVRKYVQAGGEGQLVHSLVNQAVWRHP